MPKISPRRRLPWDVLLLVFKQADPSTLAVLGQVSSDFLTSTSPELYRDVEVTSVKQLEGLFCERKVVQAGRKTKNSSKLSRINSHLSLSQMHTLSIDLTSLTSMPDSLTISSSRIDDATPIPLSHLQMSFDHKTLEFVRALYSPLLPLLNPSRCSYKAVGDWAGSLRWLALDPSGYSSGRYPCLVGWTRLEELDLSNVLPYIGSVVGARPQALAGLPRPALGQRRVVRLHLTDLDLDPSPLWKYYEVFGLNFMQRGSFFLVFETEEQRERLANVVRTTERFGRWKDVFVVEVAT